MAERLQPSHHVLMVCDFFFPRLGGVETHIWSLSQCLLRMGHKVVVLTNSYGSRTGIRWMGGGLKVYYGPIQPFVDQDAMPTIAGHVPLIRQILLRERITIVHGHAATSTLAHEVMLCAQALGYHTVYTDHSLFGFNDMASISLNKWLKFALVDVDAAIAVSHTCRENLVLRARLRPEKTAAIPNAVNAAKFAPDPSARWPADTVNVVMVSRLVYRKGVDLVAQVIPVIAAQFPNVHFIIGGDGNKRLLLEEMRERYDLHDRVELLGAVPHNRVRDVLVRGHIFLNCSLTESFCIAILEAACAGLYVVSTAVGGVPEVLPPHMISFAQPNHEDITRALKDAITMVRHVQPRSYNAQLADTYNWYDVAQRTVRVYDRVRRMPRVELWERIQHTVSSGPFQGWFALIFVAMIQVAAYISCWLWPASTVEIAPDLEQSAMHQAVHKRAADDMLAHQRIMHVDAGGTDTAPTPAGSASAMPSAAAVAAAASTGRASPSKTQQGRRSGRSSSHRAKPGLPRTLSLSAVAQVHEELDSAWRSKSGAMRESSYTATTTTAMSSAHAAGYESQRASSSGQPQRRASAASESGSVASTDSSCDVPLAALLSPLLSPEGAGPPGAAGPGDLPSLTLSPSVASQVPADALPRGAALPRPQREHAPAAAFPGIVCADDLLSSSDEEHAVEYFAGQQHAGSSAGTSGLPTAVGLLAPVQQLATPPSMPHAARRRTDSYSGEPAGRGPAVSMDGTVWDVPDVPRPDQHGSQLLAIPSGISEGDQEAGTSDQLDRSWMAEFADAIAHG